MKKVQIHYRCQTCNKDCNHDFELKMFKDESGFWVASGPYQTEEEAKQIINKAVEMTERRENKA